MKTADQESAEHDTASSLDLYSMYNGLLAIYELQHQKWMFRRERLGSKALKLGTFPMILALPYEVLHAPHAEYEATFCDEVFCYSEKRILTFPFLDFHLGLRIIRHITSGLQALT